MKNFVTTFTNKSDFEKFVADVKIQKDQDVLIQAFSGVLNTYFINEMISDVRSILPRAKIIGSTTGGEIINSELKENSFILSVTVFEKNSFETVLVAEPSPEECGMQLGDMVNEMENARIVITFFSVVFEGRLLDSEDFVIAFNENCPGIPIAGGASGDNAKFKQSYVFTENGVSATGAVAAIICGKFLDITTSFYQGCQPIGKEMVVTKAEDNRVYTLDDQKAGQLIRQFLGQVGPEAGLNFPMLTMRNKIPVVRGITSMNNDDSVDFISRFNEGEVVKFSYNIPEIFIRKAASLAEKWKELSFDSIYVFSCAARKWCSPEAASQEINLLHGCLPQSGLLTYGEFFWTGDRNEALHQTITMLALKETMVECFDPPRIIEGDKDFWDQEIMRPANIHADDPMVVLAFLHNMIKNITDELVITNRELQKKNDELSKAVDEIKSIRTLLPICFGCKKIRDDEGYWTALEEYFGRYADYEFSHGLCPDCAEKLYPQEMLQSRANKNNK